MDEKHRTVGKNHERVLKFPHWVWYREIIHQQKKFSSDKRQVY